MFTFALATLPTTGRCCAQLQTQWFRAPAYGGLGDDGAVAHRGKARGAPVDALVVLRSSFQNSTGVAAHNMGVSPAIRTSVAHDKRKPGLEPSYLVFPPPPTSDTESRVGR
jgi:hypothetical protein